MKWKFKIQSTAWFQIELLPRLTIGIFENYSLVAFEFLFWSFYAKKVNAL